MARTEAVGASDDPARRDTDGCLGDVADGGDAAVAAGRGQAFAAAIPAIMGDAKVAVARRRAEPGDDLISDLVRTQAGGGDRLSDAEVVTLVWHLVLAGQAPANLIANAVETLLAHPEQLAALRDDRGLMPRAVEEFLRWCGPQLLTIPRYAREDLELYGALIGKGEPVTAVIVSANRDPRAFADPDRLDIRRATGPSAHLGFAHGPHFCLGAALARAQTEVAITGLLRRFPRPGPGRVHAGGAAHPRPRHLAPSRTACKPLTPALT